MKISTEIASATAIIGEEKAIEYCAKARFSPDSIFNGY